MRKLPARAFPNLVYVDRTPDGSSVLGGEIAEQTPPGQAYYASVQPRKVGRDDRAVGGGATQARAMQLVDVLFQEDPNVIENNTIFFPPSVLNVLGPANDQAGYGVMWLVQCEQVS